MHPMQFQLQQVHPLQRYRRQRETGKFPLVKGYPRSMMVEMGNQKQDRLPLSWVTQGDLEKRF